MEIIDDPKIFRPLAKKAIEKYGFTPEHNLEWWLLDLEIGERPIFVCWDDGTGLLTQRAEAEWYTYSEPLALSDSAGNKIAEFTDHVLENFSNEEVEEVIAEVRPETREDVIKNIVQNYEVLPVDMELIWPVVNLKNFDPQLAGKHFKSMRNIQSRFERNHKIETVDAHEVNKKLLNDVVENWARDRKGQDDIWPQHYYNLIEAGFLGMDHASAIIVDGKPAAFYAGWAIPNSDASYYNGVAIQDYSVRDLGLFMYIQNLTWAQKAGYKTMDLGGVEVGGPLDFKNRFLPESSYKTEIFSIIRRQ